MQGLLFKTLLGIPTVKILPDRFDHDPMPRAPVPADKLLDAGMQISINPEKRANHLSKWLRIRES